MFFRRSVEIFLSLFRSRGIPRVSRSKKGLTSDGVFVPSLAGRQIAGPEGGESTLGNNLCPTSCSSLDVGAPLLPRHATRRYLRAVGILWCCWCTVYIHRRDRYRERGIVDAPAISFDFAGETAARDISTGKYIASSWILCPLPEVRRNIHAGVASSK